MPVQRSPSRARSASPIPSPVRRQLSAEPETRTSRRIKGEDPEYGQLLDKPKPKKTTMANQAQTPAAPAVKDAEETTARLASRCIGFLSTLEASSKGRRIDKRKMDTLRAKDLLYQCYSVLVDVGLEPVAVGGLDLSKTNAAQLADCIFHQTKITDFAQDQVCINTRSNFIAVSTPDERRSQQYMDLDTITWNATHYPVQSHIPPHPSITTPGAIFQIPAEDSEPLIIESLTRHNPTITVLHARRIKDTGIVQVLFLGPHVPFWAVLGRSLTAAVGNELPERAVSAEMTRLPAIHNSASSSLLLARMREDDIGAPVRCTLASSLRMKTPALDIRTPTATAGFSGRGETANRALPPTTDPHPTSSGNAEIATLRAEIETAFDNHRQHTSVQINAIQESVHSLHQEVLQWMYLAAPTTTPDL
ncbi:hypothetical protein HPB47_016723 [Ixodes persulcatus]|uniref:Uncharacterized protein n=1 Tax=Ixodes persulcatus TaxID=34615 RepID=A0AC60QQ91_IXOPE|nr:hypothetical protein HPB47_016723 [Ixodes persulcatus]